MGKGLLFSLKLTAVLFTSALSVNAQFQKLVINEVSQGGQNPAVEYVELLVAGTNSCAGSTADLRNWIIDDNNGTFLNGAGSGIAAGCIRFKNIPFWQNIKIGTLILIYDDGSTSTNPLIPAIDLNANDANCRLVIPYSNTTLIERHGTQPGISNQSYPATSAVFNSNNTWTNVIGMRNGGDSFQTRNPLNYSIPAHAVSWSDNSDSTIIYFAGDAGKKVFNMKNLVNDIPDTQANWTADSTLNGETPGIGNSPNNIAWINSMNNNCQPFVGLNLSIAASASGNSFCFGDSVTLTSSLSSGNVWSTGDTGTTVVIDSTATVTLSNPNACNQATKTLTFTGIAAAFSADTLEGIAPLTVVFTDQSFSLPDSISWSLDSLIIADSSTFTHTFVLPGTYQVMLTVFNANGCSDTATKTITVLVPPVIVIPDSANTFEIPNVFTPNNDGTNDLFLIKSSNVNTFSGLIFDRWGNKVHEWTNINQGWNGRTPSGKQLTAGVFFYVINVTFTDGSSITPSGTITIIK